MKVAAYCRVSTDKSDQANSFESQQRYFREYIDRQPDWELYDVYADEGVTGTSTRKRFEFNRMVADAEKHSFDFVVTKEISRFARNTLDSIFYTRLLKSLGIGILFVNDNINTLDPDAELRLTIMSSIAQEESRKTSDRVKWGQKRRMEQGMVFGRDMLGYHVHSGKLIVDEEGADVVRLIFHKYVNEGKGTHVIARELEEQCVYTSVYMKKWSNTSVLRVLKNEKYCGDLVQKKTFTPDYLTHQKKYNHGEEELVTLKNHHTAIVSCELFDKAQQEIERRSSKKTDKAKYTNRYCFSGKIKCGDCGSSYVSRRRERKSGTINHSWRCFETAKSGKKHIDKCGNSVGCNNVTVSDDFVKSIAMQAVQDLLIDKDRLVKNLMSVVTSVLETNEATSNPEKLAKQIKMLTQKRKRLIELYICGDISKTDYQDMSEMNNDDMLVLASHQKLLSADIKKAKNDINQINNIKAEISSLLLGDLWEDTFYRNIIDKIIINSNGTVSLTFSQISNQFCYFIN